MSASVSADWIVAIRSRPCLRMGTGKGLTPLQPTPDAAGSDWFGIRNRDHLVAEDALRFLDASLQVSNGVHLPQIHADVDQRLRDLRRQPGDDDSRAEEPCGLDREDQVI